MKKRIVYRPKTIEQAKAAVSLALRFGVVDKKWNDSQCGEPWWEGAVIYGMEFRDEKALSNPSVFTDPSYKIVEASTLDELLVALTEKPKKEPKKLPDVEIFRTTTYGGTPVQVERTVSDGNYRVWLHPDGSIQVGCTIVKREDFERIHREWKTYMEAE